MAKRFIYSLVYWDFPTEQSLEEGPDNVVFYIGQTDDPDRRLKDHQYRFKDGPEDVYAYIRELELKGTAWDLEIIREVEPSDELPWETYEIKLAIQSGVSLKNMKFGDLGDESRSIIRRLVDDPDVKDIHSFDKALKKERNHSKGGEESDYASSERLQFRAMLQSMRLLRTETDPPDVNYPRRWSIYDTGDGTEEIPVEYGMEKKEVSKLLTPASKEAIDGVKKLISD